MEISDSVMLMSRRKSSILSFLRKLVLALGIALFFALLGIFPNLGYFGEASVQVRQRTATGFWKVETNAEVLYSPFLYGFSWVRGNGYFSSSFMWISVPTYVGGDFKFPLWRNPSELAEEALIRVILDEILINIPYNFSILLFIELAKKRDLYFCLIGGIIGFPFGGLLPAAVGFFAGLFAMFFIIPRLREENSVIIRFWNSLWETEEP